MIKKAQGPLIKPLTLLINQSLSTGIFPNKLKISRVKPLFKKGKVYLFSNYRPISLLPSLSKIYEHVVFEQLLQYMEGNSLFYSISIHLGLDACATQKTESNSKVRTYYKWKETNKMIYNEANNSVECQVQLSDIKNNLSTSDTDSNDTVQIIQKVILEAAAPSKTTTCIGKFTKLQASPW